MLNKIVACKRFTILPFHKRISDNVFAEIKFNELENLVLQTIVFNRLKDVTSLSAANQVYPTTVHKRFEHSLGVMSLASDIFDRLFSPDSISRASKSKRDKLQGFINGYDLEYWKQVVRLAGLLHDLGHLSMSHVAEQAILFKRGISHETMSYILMKSPEVKNILYSYGIAVEDVAKVALNQDEYLKIFPNYSYSPFEKIMNEIVTGDAFGADRMEYMYRDAKNSGIVTGEFNREAIIKSLVLLPYNGNYHIGVMKNPGVDAVCDLLKSRKSMYHFIAYHPLTIAYDNMMKKLIRDLTPTSFLDVIDRIAKNIGGASEEDIKSVAIYYELISDSYYLSAIKELLVYGEHPEFAKNNSSLFDKVERLKVALGDKFEKALETASRYLLRQHDHKIWTLEPPNFEEKKQNMNKLLIALREHFGEEMIIERTIVKNKPNPDFPILNSSGKVYSSFDDPDYKPFLEDAFARVYFYCHPDIKEQVHSWMRKNASRVLGI